MSLLNNKKTYSAGEIIIQQGDNGNSAFIISSGSVEVLLEKDHGLVQSLGTRREGTIIGEMSIVDSKPRTATVKALEECVLLEITREDFNSRLENSDPIIKMIMKVILLRYRDMMTRAHVLGKPNELYASEDIEKGLVEQTNAIENIKISNALRDAIKGDELEIYYQPIISLKTNQIAGFEALSRWNHKDDGYIAPDIFIPIAEDNGLIIDITRKIATKSCETLKKLEKTNSTNNDYFMSVNFSSKDFSIPNFKNYIANIIQRNGLNNQQIHLEITERLLMDQPSRARETLKECRDAGITISIDDFGTGYSSLSYLHYFPIDILKIDRSFIENMEHDETSYELAKSIISLGHNMKMSIIAEGVEDEKQAEMLKEMGVDKAQGYYFAKPMPETELLKFIKNYA